MENPFPSCRSEPFFFLERQIFLKPATRTMLTRQVDGDPVPAENLKVLMALANGMPLIRATQFSDANFLVN